MAAYPVENMSTAIAAGGELLKVKEALLAVDDQTGPLFRALEARRAELEDRINQLNEI
jgi:hypothetical protein